MGYYKLFKYQLLAMGVVYSHLKWDADIQGPVGCYELFDKLRVSSGEGLAKTAIYHSIKLPKCLNVLICQAQLGWG